VANSGEAAPPGRRPRPSSDNSRRNALHQSTRQRRPANLPWPGQQHQFARQAGADQVVKAPLHPTRISTKQSRAFRAVQAHTVAQDVDGRLARTVVEADQALTAMRACCGLRRPPRNLRPRQSRPATLR
jgi:hypothetical protein